MMPGMSGYEVCEIIRKEYEDIEFRLPSMTIQPLVENAVQHGISKRKSGGNIFISIQAHNFHEVIVTVQDDGIGMSKEKQEELLNHKNDGIGFANTMKKVNLIKKSAFHLESSIDKGTKITMIFPGVKK